MRKLPLVLVLLLPSCGWVERERQEAAEAARAETLADVEQVLSETVRAADRLAGSADRILGPLPGREVGIEPTSVAKAARLLDVAGHVAAPTRMVVGVPLGVGRTVQLPRRLDDKEWARLVVELRHTFDASGRIREEGAFRQWSNGNLKALLEPTDAGEQLRLLTVKGQALGMLRGGAMVILLSVIFALASLVTGDPGDIAALSIIAVVGIGMIAGAFVGLPGWAATRQLQMDEIAERLLARVSEDRPER